MTDVIHAKPHLNIYGEAIKECSCKPMTGFFRTGRCDSDENDAGLHTVCVEVTRDFLQFSLRAGNDLITPQPQFGFPGLRPGDRWCICAARWQEALEAQVAPPVYLLSTHQRTLEVIPREILEANAVRTTVLQFPRH